MRNTPSRPRCGVLSPGCRRWPHLQRILAGHRGPARARPLWAADPRGVRRPGAWERLFRAAASRLTLLNLASLGSECRRSQTRATRASSRRLSCAAGAGAAGRSRHACGPVGPSSLHAQDPPPLPSPFPRDASIAVTLMAHQSIGEGRAVGRGARAAAFADNAQGCDAHTRTASPPPSSPPPAVTAHVRHGGTSAPLPSLTRRPQGHPHVRHGGAEAQVPPGAGVRGARRRCVRQWRGRREA